MQTSLLVLCGDKWTDVSGF